MNNYEKCFRGWYGENGKRFKPCYCLKGYNYDSKTDEKLDTPFCQDWYGRCEYLKEKPQRVPRLR